MPEFTEYAPGHAVLGRRDEPRARPYDLVLRRAFRLGVRAGFAAGGRRVCDVLEGQEARRRRDAPTAGGEPSSWATYLATDDVDATVGRIREAGGSLLLEPLDVFADGRMAIAQDPTGAAFSLWQAGEHDGAQLANDPGSLAWNECQTNDAETAAAFYCAVFATRSRRCRWARASPTASSSSARGVAGIFDLNDELRGAPASWTIVFAVADADEALARAQELGGAVLVPPLDIPDGGRFAALQDPVDAAFQVLADPAS